MPLPSALDRDPRTNRALIAWRQGIEALARQSDVRSGYVEWLCRQKPVSLNDDGWILVAYPSETEARLAGANEAMVRLGNKLRDEGLAKGVVPFVLAGAATPGQAQNGARRGAQRPPWERRPLYMPGFLVSTTLPHSDPKAAEFTRVNGNVTTTLHAPSRPGLPFGVYPRLILIHIATGAVLTKSRAFRVGRSINDLLGRMGLSHSGGAGGGGQSTLARGQLDRICATAFTTTHLSPYGGSNLVVADRWMEKTADGLEVVLSERFFEQATKSAIPLDPVVLRAVRRSPLSIDIYGWLTHRMSRLEETTSISWAALERQFGAEYRETRQFRRRFRQAVERVRNAWTGELGIELQERRVVLTPGPPSVANRTERSNAKCG